jgi:two-component system chemotaxis response regulator CheB
VLVIEMPELDGISALPKLLAKKRDLIIIMASTLTRRNAEISFKALSLGAADYIPKPESTREATAAETFRHDLIQKIRHLGAKVRRTAAPATASPPLAPHHDRARDMAARPALAPVVQQPLARRPFGMLAPKVLLIGSSTVGSDGMRGGKDIVAAGGSVIAQDEATSVVWGMPGAAANAGICAAVLPLNQIAPKLVRVFSGDRT